VKKNGEKEYKEYVFLAITLLMVFFVYLYTMFPAYKGDDSPETASDGYTLGIAHAPGYPLYTMLSKIAMFVPAANPAFRNNMLSAVLGILVLLSTYFIFTRRIFLLFGIKQALASRVLGLGSVIILAFSFIFWNQAIEAKGGIYMLNLLLLSLLICLSLELLMTPGGNRQMANAKRQMPNNAGKSAEPLTDNRQPTTVNQNLYLIAYLYGLSLANHWPSMIILAPVFAYVFYKSRKELNKGRLIICAGFLAAGLSAYLYLYIRAVTGPAINWGDPSTLGNLLAVMTRKDYAGQIMPASAAQYVVYIKYFLNFFASNFRLLWLLALPGAYALYRRRRALFWMFFAIAGLTSFILIIYNRTALEIIWLMGVFLMPVEYIVCLFISAGAAFILGKTKKPAFRAIAPAILAFFILFMGLNNAALNQRNNDFLSYDLLFNLVSEVSAGAYYLGEHDMYGMPMMYLQNVQKRRLDIKYFPLTFLLFDWGIKQAQQKFGYFPGKRGEVPYNLSGITGRVIGRGGVIFRDFTSPVFDALYPASYQDYAGLIKRVSPARFSESPKIYDLYSFRGIFSDFAKSEENIEIIMRYLIFMSMHAEKLFLTGRNMEAIGLYKKALLIPAPKLAYNIYYKIAQAYDALNEKTHALVYFKKAIADRQDFNEAYQAAGILYYKDNDIYNAGKMFELAVRSGSNDAKLREFIQSAVPVIRKNEEMLTAADAAAMTKDYGRAENIYSSFIRQGYRASELLLKLGMMYYEAGRREKALLYFEGSNKKEPNAKAYFYSAVIYNEKGMPKEALKSVSEGIALFKDDPDLKQMHEQFTTPKIQ
jgi:tetratricopeptide (TPR) repeat protein